MVTKIQVVGSSGKGKRFCRIPEGKRFLAKVRATHGLGMVGMSWYVDVGFLGHLRESVGLPWRCCSGGFQSLRYLQVAFPFCPTLHPWLSSLLGHGQVASQVGMAGQQKKRLQAARSKAKCSAMGTDTDRSNMIRCFGNWKSVVNCNT